jgi:CRP-like cAMP-binding protein
MGSATARDFNNRLLRDLPRTELAVFDDALERVRLLPGQVIQVAGRSVERLHFVESGMVSMVGIVDECDPIEVFGVGYAGMVGTGALREDGIGALQALVQIEGEALVLPGEHFARAFKTCPTLRRHTTRYRDLAHLVTVQSALCMARHDLGQRLARWLLKVSDIMLSPQFRVTQDCIASLLGVARPSLSTEARELQDAGLIRVCRGRITIIDREALELAACSCYHVLQRHYRAWLSGED